VNAFLNGYELEIAYCREHNIEATEEIISLWTSLLEGEYAPQLVTVVSPMLTLPGTKVHTTTTSVPVRATNIPSPAVPLRPRHRS
jgi:hypothetical protein